MPLHVLKSLMCVGFSYADVNVIFSRFWEIAIVLLSVEITLCIFPNKRNYFSKLQVNIRVYRIKDHD